MNQTFGQIFQCQLVNNTVTSFKIPFDGNGKLRVLLISDTHIGAVKNLDVAIQMFIDELQKIIEDEKIDMICHLGDLVDGTLLQGTFVLNNVLKKLSELKKPVYVIGGNHDRDFLNALNWQKDPYVTPLKENARFLIRSLD